MIVRIHHDHEQLSLMVRSMSIGFMFSCSQHAIRRFTISMRNLPEPNDDSMMRMLMMFALDAV